MRKALIAAVLSLSVSAFAYAAEPTEQELIIFTAHKYKADYAKQPEEAQQELKKEFSMISAVVPKLMSQGLADDAEYKIAAQTLGFEIWVRKYAESINISDEDLKKIYDEREIKKAAEYGIHNILLNDEKTADSIMKSLSAIKDKKALAAKFESLAKEKSIDPVTAQKGGNAGMVELDRLEKPLQEAIANKKPDDFFKYKAGAGWQVIYIDSFRPAGKASFEEAKPMLVNIIKRVEVGKKIQTLMQEQ